MKYEEIYDKDYFSGKKSFFYAFGYGRFLGPYFNTLFKRIIKYIEEIKVGRVLDVGCAYGFMLQRFPDSFEKFGLDVSKYAIDIARERLPAATFEVGNAEDALPFEEDFFDIVLMNDLIEHLGNPEAALENVWRILKAGGILYITTPNLNRIRKILFRYPDKKEHHISMFTHSDLAELLENLGFEAVEHWTYINSPFINKKFKSNIGLESAFICRK